VGLAVSGAGERVACVDVPALALQLVLRAHPEWSADPVVVVADDRPHAPIVWCNRAARAHRIRRGASFAEAKALSATLHAAVVPEHELAAGVDALFALLLPFSPAIEPAQFAPGLFWLDPRGLSVMFGDLAAWAAKIHRALSDAGFVSAVIVGFSRHNALALARVGTGPHVLPDREQEDRRAGRVPLARLGVPPGFLRDMELLDIQSVAELRALPPSQLRARYGEEAARWHEFLSGKAYTPLIPREPMAPFVLTLEVDPPDDDCTRLLFGLKAALDDAALRLRAQHTAISALCVEFALERLRAEGQRIEAAAPTLDVPQLVDLLRLRLSNVALPARVERLTVTLELARVHPRQLAIEHGKKPRDLEAGKRAIARLRASFGPEAVTRAALHEAHLPEAAYRFELANEVRLPRPRPVADAPLVRRVLHTPRPLSPRPRHEPEAWPDQGGAVIRMSGAHRVAGGWWLRRRERDYHFAELQGGEVWWIFYDRVQRRWFLHGSVD
jgi:protein ImuB